MCVPDQCLGRCSGLTPRQSLACHCWCVEPVFSQGAITHLSFAGVDLNVAVVPFYSLSRLVCRSTSVEHAKSPERSAPVGCAT